MGDARERTEENVFTMDEVRRHTKPDDAWLVVDDKVYNVSNFWKKHPGGQNMILAFAGMDASVRDINIQMDQFKKGVFFIAGHVPFVSLA